MELYTKQLTPNQVFKNYKELCTFLHEEVKGGCAKKAQLKDWENYFTYSKDGNKFIITEIFETPKEKVERRGGSHNTKNIQPIMDYILSTFDENEYMNEYMTISNWSTKVFHLLKSDVCSVVYENDKTIAEFCNKHKLADVSFFKLYLKTIKFVIKKLLTTSFRTLAKREHIEMYEGYKFAYDGENCYKQSCVKYVGTSALNEMVDEMERTLCNSFIETYFKDRKIKGKQLLYFLQQDVHKELFKEYIESRTEYMNNNKDFLNTLNFDVKMNGDEKLNGTDKRVNTYFTAYEIVGFDLKDFEKVDNKQEVFAVIKRLAYKQMCYIKEYNEDLLCYEHPYEATCYREEMRKINNILLDGADKDETLKDFESAVKSDDIKDIEEEIFCDDDIPFMRETAMKETA